MARYLIFFHIQYIYVFYGSIQVIYLYMWLNLSLIIPVTLHYKYSTIYVSLYYTNVRVPGTILCILGSVYNTRR